MKTVRLLCWLVALTAWATALLPFRVAGWLLTLYITQGGWWPLGLHVAFPSLAWASAYILLGVLYLRIPALRVYLLLFSALLATSGLVKTVGSLHQLSTLNVWHNVLAEGFWEACGCALISITALIQQIASRQQSRSFI